MIGFMGLCGADWEVGELGSLAAEGNFLKRARACAESCFVALKGTDVGAAVDGEEDKFIGCGGGGLESRLVGGGVRWQGCGGDGVRVVLGGGFISTEGFFGTGGFLADAEVALSEAGVDGIGELVVTESCCSCDCIWEMEEAVIRGGGKSCGFLGKFCADELVVFSEG